MEYYCAQTRSVIISINVISHWVIRYQLPFSHSSAGKTNHSQPLHFFLSLLYLAPSPEIRRYGNGRWFGLELFLYERYEIYCCILCFFHTRFVLVTSRYVSGQMQTVNLVPYSEMLDRYRQTLRFECLDLKYHGDLVLIYICHIEPQVL